MLGRQEYGNMAGIWEGSKRRVAAPPLPSSKINKTPWPGLVGTKI